MNGCSTWVRNLAGGFLVVHTPIGEEKSYRLPFGVKTQVSQSEFGETSDTAISVDTDCSATGGDKHALRDGADDASADRPWSPAFRPVIPDYEWLCLRERYSQFSNGLLFLSEIK